MSYGVYISEGFHPFAGNLVGAAEHGGVLTWST